jgi:Tol biopolymer transport system component
VTSANATVVLPPEWLSGAKPFFPSISRDGSVVAAARWKHEADGLVVIETYSLLEGKWTQHAEGKYRGGVAISADGSKLAVIAREGEPHSYVDRVQVIDLKTGETRRGPEFPGVVPVMSWSPDGKRLAYGDGRIEVWDTETDKHWQIAEGGMAAWSPDGEWIAFLNTSDDPEVVGADECLEVHPDGSGTRSLARLHGHHLFLEGVVWSPDSKMLLLNEVANFERWTMNIDLLDVASLKLKRVQKNKIPVFGWAKEQIDIEKKN